MSRKTVYGIFDDEEVLLNSVKEIKSNNIDIKEVYTPFPVHGLDKELGLKETRMAIAAFVYGCLGITFARITLLFLVFFYSFSSFSQDVFDLGVRTIEIFFNEPNWDDTLDQYYSNKATPLLVIFSSIFIMIPSSISTSFTLL